MPCSTRSAARSVHAARRVRRPTGVGPGPGTLLTAPHGRVLPAADRRPTGGPAPSAVLLSGRPARGVSPATGAGPPRSRPPQVSSTPESSASGCGGISGRTQRPRRAPRGDRAATAHRSTRRRPAAANRRRRLRSRCHPRPVGRTSGGADRPTAGSPTADLPRTTRGDRSHDRCVAPQHGPRLPAASDRDGVLRDPHRRTRARGDAGPIGPSTRPHRTQRG